MAKDKKTIMISGLDGKMATILAQGILRIENEKDYFPVPLVLCNVGFTGKSANYDTIIAANHSKGIHLIEPKDHGAFLANPCAYYNKLITDDKPKKEDELKINYIIDACKGEGVADRNAKMYAKHKIPFVMLSTGAYDEYTHIDRVTKEAGIPCVAAPNMDARIVAWMYAIQKMSEDLFGAFKGANVDLIESHQADKVNKNGKPETSGTMKQMLRYTSELVVKDCIIDDIKSIRDPNIQKKELKIPDKYISWHAYHLIRFSSDYGGNPDSEEIVFTRHGGECYKDGAMRALEYLIKGHPTPGRHTMIDVMKAGF